MRINRFRDGRSTDGVSLHAPGGPPSPVSLTSYQRLPVVSAALRWGVGHCPPGARGGARVSDQIGVRAAQWSTRPLVRAFALSLPYLLPVSAWDSSGPTSTPGAGGVRESGLSQGIHRRVHLSRAHWRSGGGGRGRLGRPTPRRPWLLPSRLRVGSVAVSKGGHRELRTRRSETCPASPR